MTTAETTIATRDAVQTPSVRSAGRLLFAASVLLLCAWILVPIYFLIDNALSSPEAISDFPKSVVPSFDTASLRFFFNYEGVLRALWNSILVATLTMALSIMLGAPAGYALSRFDFVGKSMFRMLILMTRAFPLPLLALPLAVLFIRVGLDDSPIGLAAVHTTLALPFSVLTTFSIFSGIPLELEEAAWTLGCNRAQAFRKIVLPLVLPGIAASAIFAFATSWNEVFAASVLTVQNQTLTAFLLQSLSWSPMHLRFAGGAVLIIPPLVFMFAVRKYMFAMWGIANR
jgi:multiple sugar transport system permease protein